MTLLALSAQPLSYQAISYWNVMLPRSHPTPQRRELHQAPTEEPHLRIKWWGRMRMPLPTCLHELGSVGRCPCSTKGGSRAFFPTFPFFFTFFLCVCVPVDSVISQLDKLVRGSSGKVWHRGWSDCWVCREKRPGSCGRQQDVSLGAGRCSRVFVALRQYAPLPQCSLTRPGTWRREVMDQSAMWVNGTSQAVWSCMCAPLYGTVNHAWGLHGGGSSQHRSPVAVCVGQLDVRGRCGLKGRLH